MYFLKASGNVSNTFSEEICPYMSGAPNGSVPQNICSSGKFLLAGRFGRRVLLGNRQLRVYLLFVWNLSPTPSTKGANFGLWPHPNWPVMDIRLLGNFPLSQVAGCSCILLGRNSSISLAGSEEQINFSQQSPKMLKMASETFIHTLLFLLGLFLKISRCVPLMFERSLKANKILSS